MEVTALLVLCRSVLAQERLVVPQDWFPDCWVLVALLLVPSAVLVGFAASLAGVDFLAAAAYVVARAAVV